MGAEGLVAEAVGGGVGGRLWMDLECTFSLPSRRPSWERRDSKASVSLSSTGSSEDPSLSSLFQKSPRLGGARDYQDFGRQRGPSSGLEQKIE